MLCTTSVSKSLWVFLHLWQDKRNLISIGNDLDRYLAVCSPPLQFGRQYLRCQRSSHGRRSGVPKGNASRDSRSAYQRYNSSSAREFSGGRPATHQPHTSKCDRNRHKDSGNYRSRIVPTFRGDRGRILLVCIIK